MIILNNIVIKRPEFKLNIPRLKLNRGLTLLVGRNGSGKTTLLELLATAIQPDRGKVLYGGKSVNTDLPLIRSHIGYVPSGLELYEEMTVSEFLHYFASLKGNLPGHEVIKLIEYARLSSVQHEKLGQLSLGQQQRTAIVQSLLGSPYFLFLDEPLNNLDSLEQKNMLRLFQELSDHACIVAVTHELNSWESSEIEAILWIDQGEVRFYDRPESWVYGLGKKVWVGIVEPGDHYPSIMSIRMLEDGQKEVRVIAEEPPDERFQQVQTTLEDAYFIRQRSLDAQAEQYRH